MQDVLLRLCLVRSYRQSAGGTEADMLPQPLRLQALNEGLQCEFFLLAVIEGGVALASVQAQVGCICTQTLLLAPF